MGSNRGAAVRRTELIAADFAAAAAELGVEVAAVRAFAVVEAGPWGAFLPTSEPVVLFERHVFSRRTGGRFDLVAPDLSSPLAGGYGRVGEQHRRLARAVALDRPAALEATSWGLFQVLGAGWRSLGLPSVQAVVNLAYRDVGGHLELFERFVAARPALVAALRARDWWTVARIYNGPAHWRHDYAGRFARAYQAVSAD